MCIKTQAPNQDNMYGSFDYGNTKWTKVGKYLRQRKSLDLIDKGQFSYLLLRTENPLCAANPSGFYKSMATTRRSSRLI